MGKAYRQRLSELMVAFRKKHGIKKEVTDRGAISKEYRAEEVQLALFG